MGIVHFCPKRHQQEWLDWGLEDLSGGSLTGWKAGTGSQLGSQPVLRDCMLVPLSGRVSTGYLGLLTA